MEVGDRVSAGDSFDHEVAFFGNIYLAASGKLPYAAQPEFTQLRRRVSETRSANPRLSFYHAYRDAIAALQPSARSRLRLDPDQSFYWRVMFDELTHYMNGEERLRAMQSCGRAVDFFGNFNDPDSNTLMPAACRSRGALPYGPQLAESFRRTRVTVDVANAAFINGFSVKLVDCFASGGFALTDRKADVARAFGPIADEISYDGTEELAAKVDFYLGRPDRRRDIAREIGATVREKYSTHTLFTDVIPKALQRLSRPVWRRLLGYRRSARLDPSPPVVRPLMGVSLDLVHTAPHWTGASVIKGRPVAIQTVDAPWGYSAILPLRALRERHVAEPGKLFWEIDAEAAEGTSSIGVIKGDQMLSEQLVDGRQTFYLPADEVDADLIVRNGPQEGSSRVLIHRLRLVWVKRS